jgi:hypothetical protein
MLSFDSGDVVVIHHGADSSAALDRYGVDDEPGSTGGYADMSSLQFNMDD